ncbi:MAG: hypothetical protein ABII76_17190, partial [Pseudomonadota bacterium]
MAKPIARGDPRVDAQMRRGEDAPAVMRRPRTGRHRRRSGESERDEAGGRSAPPARHIFRWPVRLIAAAGTARRARS